MKIVRLVCMVLSLASPWPAYSTVRDPALMGIRYYDPLQDSHVVVRGTVIDTQSERRTISEWGFDRYNSSPLEIQKVTIAVAEVLKGEWHEPEMVVFTLSGPWEFTRSEQYVFCAKWHDTSTERIMTGGTVIGLYENEGNKWVTCEFNPPPNAQREEQTYEQLLIRVRGASLTSVVDSSEIIVRGVIDSVWTSTYPANGNRVGRLTHWRIRVGDRLKGEASGDHVEFVVPMAGTTYVPKWYRAVPKIPLGTEWIVFLKSGVKGLYPFSGPNSLLQIRDEKLIYDNKASYELNLPQATRAIHAEVTDAQN